MVVALASRVHAFWSSVGVSPEFHGLDDSQGAKRLAHAWELLFDRFDLHHELGGFFGVPHPHRTWGRRSVDFQGFNAELHRGGGWALAGSHGAMAGSRGRLEDPCEMVSLGTKGGGLHVFKT